MTNKKLCIAFDAKRITHNRTGLGNYGRTVVEMLARFAPENRYQLYTPDPGREELRNRLAGLEAVEFRYPLTPKRGVFRALWRSYGIARELPRDTALFHGLSGELPFGLRKAGIRSVVTVHDLIYLRFPAYYKPIDRFIYAWKCRKACEQADRVIAISEATKRDLIGFFGVPAEKIDVVYQGCDEQFKHEAPEAVKSAVREKYVLPEHYALTVGSIEERKNLLLLVRAVERMEERTHIVAVGKRTPYTAEVEQYAARHGLAPWLHILSGVPFADLPAIYQSADLFVYPSRFEGFGIPMIEAAFSRVPSIGATGSCLEEAGGPGAFYVDPDDPEALAVRIGQIRSDEALRRRMTEAGRTYVERFEPEVIVRDLMDVYGRVLGAESRNLMVKSV